MSWKGIWKRFIWVFTVLGINITLPYSSLLPLFSQSISSEPSKQSLVPSQIHLTGTQICWSYLHLKEFSLHTKLDAVSLQNNRKYTNCFILANWVIEHIYYSTQKHSRNQQRTDQRVLVLTSKFLALKKQLVFPPVKNTSQFFFEFFLPLFYATF